MPIRRQTKQMTIKKAFKRAQTLQLDDNETNELKEEVHQLQLKVKEKQNELFKIQTEAYKRKLPAKRNVLDMNFPPIQTEAIMATNEIQKLKDALYQMSLITGMEVQSFEENDHCSVVFYMQHPSENLIKHGLKVNLKNGRQDISEQSFPLGFNLSGAMDEYDNIMAPKCLGSIRNALITYYNRLDQFEHLKSAIFMDVQLFKTLDASHIEMSFTLYDERDADEDTIDIILVLEYRVHDIRPKQIHIKYIDGPNHVQEIILQQCAVFKERTLLKAFKEAFVNGIRPYKLIKEELPRNPERRPRPKPHRSGNLNNDDTFRPEECSDIEDEDED